MTAFLARNRLILLAWAAMLVLLLVTALFSPGFLSASNLRSVLVLAAFTGIVALGQTFVIIGGGIDLSVPWVLNCAAILMTLLCAGPGEQDRPIAGEEGGHPARLRAERSARELARTATRRITPETTGCQ